MAMRGNQGKGARRHACLALVALVASLPHGGAVGAPALVWPEIAPPPGVASFATGGDASVDGLPLRMYGIVSALPPSQVAVLFRARLGAPLVETTRGATLVLGRALGEFYVTVQLEPAGPGTRGVVAVSRPGAALREYAVATESRRHLLARFPAGSRLLSRSSVVDGARRAELLALDNGLGVDLNVRHLSRALAAQGYALRQTSPAAGRDEGVTLFFTRRDGQASAVIFRDRGGRTAIALNTVTDMEPAK